MPSFYVTKEELALFIGDNFIGKLSDLEVDGSFMQITKKENTMQYMTNQMLQRFMSHMSKTLANIQNRREELKEEISTTERPVSKYIHSVWNRWKKQDRESYIKNSKLQKKVKDGVLSHATLQQMEKVVTTWLVVEQIDCDFHYIDYLENRYDPFYRNRSKQAKRKLAKLVELQQAIRKQKRITRNLHALFSITTCSRL